MFMSIPGHLGIYLEYFIVVIRFFSFISFQNLKKQSMKTCFGPLEVYRKCHEFNVLFCIAGFYFIRMLSAGGCVLQNYTEPIMPNSN